MKTYNSILFDKVYEHRLSSSEDFNKYLLNNKMLLSFIKEKRDAAELNDKDRKYLQRAEQYETVYFKSLELLNRIATENKIRFLLYKTDREFGEVVDGDIDIIVHQSDFEKLFALLREEGFDCFEDEPGKGKCIKEGFSVIEPHCSISWRGAKGLSTEELFENPIQLSINGISLEGVSRDVEIIVIAIKILMEPNYLDLYSLLYIKKYYQNNIDQIIKKYIDNNVLANYLAVFFSKYIDLEVDRTYPRFLGIVDYTKYWILSYRTGLVGTHIFLLHICFYLYWRVRYRFIQKLPFTHDWDIK